MSVTSSNELLLKRVKSNIILKRTYAHVRLMSIAGAANDTTGYNEHFNSIKSLQDEVEKIFIPRFKNIFDMDKNKYSLILSENDYLQNYYVSSLEFSTFFEANIKMYNDYEFNDWNYNETTNSMFESGIYRFFMGKYK